jgi:hypothetical protein
MEIKILKTIKHKIKANGENGEILNFLIIVLFNPTYIELMVMIPFVKQTETNIAGSNVVGDMNTEMIKNKIIGNPILKNREIKERRQKLKSKIKFAKIISIF